MDAFKDLFKSASEIGIIVPYDKIEKVGDVLNDYGVITYTHRPINDVISDRINQMILRPRHYGGKAEDIDKDYIIFIIHYETSADKYFYNGTYFYSDFEFKSNNTIYKLIKFDYLKSIYEYDYSVPTDEELLKFIE